MKEKKLLELQKRLKEVEFKCSQQELYEYLIAKYTIEYSQNDKSKQKLKCIPTSASFICEFFSIDYLKELDASISKFYSSMKNPTDLFETCFYLINKFESKSIDDEIEYRTLLKNSLIKNLENFKNVYADELNFSLEIESQIAMVPGVLEGSSLF